jgi:hypothetical protein
MPSFYCEMLARVLEWQKADVAVPDKWEIELSWFCSTAMKLGH